MRGYVALLIAVAAVGCSTPVTEQTGKAVPAERVYRSELAAASPERTAKVVFARDAGMSGAACTVAVRVDEQEVFALRSGEYQTLYLAPGKHSFEAEFDASGLCPARFATLWDAVLADGAEESYRVVLQSGPRIAVLGATVEGSGRSAGEPPFEWDYVSTDGASLAVKENRRFPDSGRTTVLYTIEASGFSPDQSSVLWWMRGEAFSPLPATIDANGAVRVLGQEHLAVSDFVAGQRVDLALESGNRHAFVTTVPFPIEAKNGPFSASVELLSEDGSAFTIIFGGFEPNEKVETVSERPGQRRVDTLTATGKGFVVMPVVFDPGDRGSATAAATGSRGGVSIRYRVGKDALSVQ